MRVEVVGGLRGGFRGLPIRFSELANGTRSESDAKCLGDCFALVLCLSPLRYVMVFFKVVHKWSNYICKLNSFFRALASRRQGDSRPITRIRYPIMG